MKPRCAPDASGALTGREEKPRGAGTRPRAVPWERLLPLPELALRVSLSVRLVLEDNSD
jgi:hypothetical protein